MRSIVSAIILTVVAATTLSAQDPIDVQRLSGPIDFDGMSDEAAWQAIAPLSMTMYEPTFRGTPTYRTEIRIAFDDIYLYVSGRMWDDGPDSRQVSSLQRDRISNDDALFLLLDTFNDNENGVIFATTPAAVRFDATIGGDGQGFFGGGIISSWNTFWDAAVQQTEEGWFAEMRIPFSSLRFQDSDGSVTMGLKVYRRITKMNETVSYPETRTEWNAGLERPSKYQDVTFSNVTRQNPIYITPYALLGGTTTPQLNSTNTDFVRGTEEEIEAGLDVKYGLTSNLTLDLTVNTDFAQVEADNQQVNLTRFSLFFPERRQFFLERSGIFNISLNDFARVFHSRRIGLRDDGTPVRILGGVRLQGRAGDWDIGVINLQTASDGAFPSENNGVFRFRRRAFNDASYVGTMVTTRLGDNGDHNIVYAIDGTIRVFGNDYMEFQAAQSIDSDIDYDGINSARLRFVWQRRANRGFGYGTWITRSGASFNPGLGFIQRTDFMRYELFTSYGYFPGEKTAFRSITPLFFGTVFYRNGDHTVVTANVNNSTNFNFKSGANIGFGASYNFEDLRQGFSLSADAAVPAGSHRFTTGFVFFGSAPGHPLRIFGNANFGEFFDGTQIGFGASPTWIASNQLRLSANYQYTKIEFSQRAQEFISHLVRLRAEGQVDAHLSGSAFVQFSSAADALVGNIRFRYHFTEGRDVYFVYNETVDTDRGFLAGTQVRDPLSLDRTLVVKYIHTFIR